MITTKLCKISVTDQNPNDGNNDDFTYISKIFVSHQGIYLNLDHCKFHWDPPRKDNILQN